MVEPYYTCTHETPTCAKIGEIVDTNFLNFVSSIGIFQKLYCSFEEEFHLHLLTKVSLFTIICISFGSFPRTVTLLTIKSSPLSKPVFLIVSLKKFKLSPPLGSDLLATLSTEILKTFYNLPTQEIPDNNEVQKKLQEIIAQIIIPAPLFVIIYEEIFKPKEIQHVPNGSVLLTLLGNQIITAGENVPSISEYIFGIYIWTSGGSKTVSGTPIYLTPSTSKVIIGSQTVHP